MLSPKFVDEQDERHSGNLHWAWFLDYPIRHSAESLVLKNEDYSKLSLVSDFKFYLFDLSNEKDQEYYRWVNDRIYGGIFSLITKERRWDEKTNKILVYMEWCQNYLEFTKIVPEMVDNTKIPREDTWP